MTYMLFGIGELGCYAVYSAAAEMLTFEEMRAYEGLDAEFSKHACLMKLLELQGCQPRGALVYSADKNR